MIKVISFMFICVEYYIFIERYVPFIYHLKVAVGCFYWTGKAHNKFNENFPEKFTQ